MTEKSDAMPPSPPSRVVAREVVDAAGFPIDFAPGRTHRLGAILDHHCAAIGGYLQNVIYVGAGAEQVHWDD